MLMKEIKNSILSFLSTEEKEQFLNELLDALSHFKNTKDIKEIEECIENWEDVAELNSIPNFKERVWERFNRLKMNGKIN